MQPLLKGRPIGLSILDFGLFQVHANGRIIGICGYVIETDQNEVVLIDSGFPPKYAADAQAATQEDDLGAFGQVLELSEHNLAPAQLGKLGLTPDDIDLMIQSHTHIDHVGYLDRFEDIPILISAAERALPKPLYWSGKQSMDWPDRTYHLVNADLTLSPGLEVLLTPGHAPGQLAFVLELPQTGPVVLTSDAISRAEEIDEKFAGSWNEELAIYHGARLMALAQDRDAKVIFGHSPEQWPTLRKAPFWYR